MAPHENGLSAPAPQAGTSPNPYAPPTADDAPRFAPTHDASAQAELEQIRLEHIKREANIKAIGTLFLVGCGLALLGSLALFVSTLSGGGLSYTLPFLALMGVLGVVYGFIGVWTRKLLSAGRIGATLVIGLWLLFRLVQGVSTASEIGSSAPMAGVGMAALFPTLFLYVLWSDPSGTIFSDHYRTVVVPATPHVKYSSALAKVLLGVLLLILVIVLLSQL